MKRVVVVAPEFPPANSAATHRSRIFATHLPSHGWKPIILTVKEDQIEGPLDYELNELLPADLEIERTSAIPIRPFRVIGDMGLRCLWHHQRALEKICKKFKIDLIFIPGPPWFTFLLGPYFLKRYGIPFVIDYIDPWASDWSAGAQFPSKRWIYHKLARHYEGKVLERAAYVTAVSQGIYDNLKFFYPFVRLEHFRAMPYGGDLADFDGLSKSQEKPPDFYSGDGNFNVCFTGALQPRGFEILRVFFSAACLIRQNNPDLFRKLKLRFYGTSNLTWGYQHFRVSSVAREFGLEETVSEIPQRVPYLQSLAIQRSATLNLIMGSYERYYHASKLYSCLLANKPILAVCHEEASIMHVLKELEIEDFVVFSEIRDLPLKVEELYSKMIRLLSGEKYTLSFQPARFEKYSAVYVTKILADVFQEVIASR